MRQILFTVLFQGFALAFTANAATPGPVLTLAQQKLVDRDSCAKAAVAAATSAFVDEIKSAGVDLPEQIFVATLTPIHSGSNYSVTFVGGDTTFRVETQMGPASCRFTGLLTAP